MNVNVAKILTSCWMHIFASVTTERAWRRVVGVKAHGGGCVVCVCEPGMCGSSA